jgi:hypothetical protein
MEWGISGDQSGPDLRDTVRNVVRPINRETTNAMYITPAKDSNITSARASGRTGMMSLRPTLDSTLKLRNSNSIQVRGFCGLIAAMKLPGYHCWHTD